MGEGARTLACRGGRVVDAAHELVVDVGRQFLELLARQAGELVAGIAVCRVLRQGPSDPRQDQWSTHVLVDPAARAPSLVSQPLRAV